MATDEPLFSPDEVRAALELIMTPAEAAEAMRLIYTEAGGFENVACSKEFLDALASLSDDAASRVGRVAGMDR